MYMVFKGKYCAKNATQHVPTLFFCGDKCGAGTYYVAFLA